MTRMTCPSFCTRFNGSVYIPEARSIVNYGTSRRPAIDAYDELQTHY
jgi:hypothetical protein